MESKKKKVYLKIHLAINVKTKKIISMMKVSDEHVHHTMALPELVEDIAKSKSVTIDEILADGAYDGNDIFACLSDNGILPCIKVRKNVRIKLKTNHILRNLNVISQRNDLKKWKDSIVI